VLFQHDCIHVLHVAQALQLGYAGCGLELRLQCRLEHAGQHRVRSYVRCCLSFLTQYISREVCRDTSVAGFEHAIRHLLQLIRRQLVLQLALVLAHLALLELIQRRIVLALALLQCVFVRCSHDVCQAFAADLSVCAADVQLLTLSRHLRQLSLQLADLVPSLLDEVLSALLRVFDVLLLRDERQHLGQVVYRLTQHGQHAAGGQTHDAAARI